MMNGPPRPTRRPYDTSHTKYLPIAGRPALVAPRDNASYDKYRREATEAEGDGATEAGATEATEAGGDGGDSRPGFRRLRPPRMLGMTSIVGGVGGGGGDGAGVG
jgi:hypothetical protein